MHTDNDIPILIIASVRREIQIPDGLVVAGRFTPEDVIVRRGLIQGSAEVAILDMNDMTQRQLIVCGLLLRNEGRTVIVCDAGKVVVDLVRDIHNFTTRIRLEGRQVRTELLFSEEAIHLGENVGEIIAEFERVYLDDDRRIQ